MSDALRMLFGLADCCDQPGVDYDDVECWGWPNGEVDRCVAAGLLSPAEPSRYLTCRECDEQPLQEIVFVTDKATRNVHAYLPCHEVGPVEIPLERLQRWEMNLAQVMDAVFADFIPDSGREEVVPGRVWRLSRYRWAGTNWNVFFARGLHRHDAWQVIEQARFSRRSVVFVPSRMPDDPRIESLPIVIPLVNTVSWNGTGLQFDHDYVEDQLASFATEPAGQPDSRRSRRAPAIERLTDAVRAHLRSARDHAVSTRDLTGVPQLLPRPEQKFLAKQLGMSESQVSRSFRDDKAKLLRILWESAQDLDQVLAYRE